ncbi:sulfur oxidation protein SoxY [Thermocrinis albus DSM 14484]|uniref:Sulfur oxidation protein SoxY n=1 Tax=Thermocrinis albus (strain DSM 14484 / JCM 11386 / HI 11/12) TaxID=638303 RepID=D3SQG3_THEAH|nr:thiosulfate oxidation carrier protein SoxY [Thermocrinis albus]ADC89400.1 sulfur oxidation protein SoxY [Thermocrinis albus DSM 14484]
MDRRRFLLLGAVLTVGMLVGPTLKPSFGASKLEEEVKKRVGVDLATIKESGDVKLTVPTIAESGANVPVTVETDIPADKIQHLWIFVDNNPLPWILDVKVTPQNGKFWFSTRIKMGQTSNVRAIFKLADGSYVMATKEVKVTAGGCG